MNAQVNPDLKTSQDLADGKLVDEVIGNQPITAALATFAADYKGNDIPPFVRFRALHHMLDAAGIAVAASRYDHPQRVLTAIRGLGSEGNVPVLGLPARLSARDAALVNGYLCHSLDYDDTHVAGIIHPTASIFPAALSAAAQVGASGSDLVTAYIIGVEAAARIAAVAKSGFHQVGFHPTGIVGVFGSALAAGRLMGLNRRALEMAQGIAVSMASGSLEFVEDGAWNKRLHPGWAAQAGITAAALAREGFVGATRPYDGRFGLFRSYMGSYADKADHSLATAGLGQVWELMQTAIKPFPACHFTHGCIDAALALRRQGVTAAQVRDIEVRVPAGTHKVICEPEANKLNPANSYDAQFSVQWLTAAALVKGRLGLAELEADRIGDPEISALIKKVRFADYPDSPFPRAYSGEVIVTLNDGRKLAHREHINRGAADRPLTNAEIIEKFRANAATAFGSTTVERMERAMLSLEASSDAATALKVFSPAT